MLDIDRGHVPPDEERRLHEANALAAVLFRQELLRTAVPWPAALLASWGVRGVLNPGSVWQVGYAPDGGETPIVDRLREAGFGRETLLRSGLASWADDGQVVDRYRDQLVVVSHDQRLDPVGFVGIDRDGQAQPITPETPVHRRSEALVGVLEQIDMLEAGATAVIVDHPLDAVAIEIGSRRGSNRYAGIPLYGTPISKYQAAMLRQYCTSDRVIVMVPDEPAAGQRAMRNVVDLAGFFDHARMIESPCWTSGWEP
jgi:DNA primase